MTKSALEIIRLRQELATVEIELRELRAGGVASAQGSVGSKEARAKRIRASIELEMAKGQRAELRRDLRVTRNGRAVLGEFGDGLGEAYGASIEWLEAALEESESEIRRLQRLVSASEGAGD